MRPVLLIGGSDKSTLQHLRNVYAEALASDKEKRDVFDRLKYILYADFLRFGKLPRSNDGLAQIYTPATDGNSDNDFSVFLSYARLKSDRDMLSPDDESHTQYKRMVCAIEELLELHPTVNKDSLRIWMVSPSCKSCIRGATDIVHLQDYACVDQDDPALGVSVLPIIVAQCNVVISLVDNKYYDRAWCSVEVMMVQRLKMSYKHHLWYEHVVEKGGSKLQDRPMNLNIVMANKKLTFEEDRPRVLFLERQQDARLDTGFIYSDLIFHHNRFISL